MKKILIISSEYTGHGHKSITESLCEKFVNEEVSIHVIDGFSLGGSTLLKVAKSYGPITRTSEALWELIYDISTNKPSLINEIIEMKIKENLLILLKTEKPDLILSVHPNYVGSIINILEKNRINIPVVTLIADLISICALWADRRAHYTISPTIEAKEKCIRFGVPEEKIKVLGFPVRSRFCEQSKSITKSKIYNPNTPLRCLMMSGGEGVGNMNKIAEILLNNFNCIVEIVAGRNKRLQKRLAQTLEKYGDKVIIHGYLKNIQELMLAADIAITRGSPNVIMEAVSCNLPLVITGALPGQEEENPAFAEKYNLAVICTNTKNIKNTVQSLLDDNGRKLNQIKKFQMDYTDPNIAQNIVDFIMSINTDKSQIFIQPVHTRRSEINRNRNRNIRQA